MNLFSIVIFAQTNFLFVPCECRSSAYGLRTSKDEALFDWLFVEEDNKKGYQERCSEGVTWDAIWCSHKVQEELSS